MLNVDILPALKREAFSSILRNSKSAPDLGEDRSTG